MASVLLESAFLVKAEAAYNTNPTASPATNAVFGFDLETQVENSSEAPDYRDGTAGARDVIQTTAHRTFTVSVPLSGAGTGTVSSIASSADAVRWEALAEACGWIQSHTGNPIHQRFRPTTLISASVWLELYQRITDGGGIKHTVSGARGNTVLRLAADEVAKLTFSLLGIYNTGTEVTSWATTLSALAFDQEAPPPCRGMTLTVDTVGTGLSELEIDLGVATEVRPDMTATHGVGEITAHRTGPVAIKFKIPEPDIATYDWYTEIRTAGATQALSVTWGSAAGNKFTLVAPAFVATSVSRSETGGIMYLDVEGIAKKVSGDDEVTLEILDA